MQCNLCRCQVTIAEASAAAQVHDGGDTLCIPCAWSIAAPGEDEPVSEQEDWERLSWERVADMEQDDE